MQYIGVDGNPLTLRCANYFGFDNGQTMFDGLWAGGSALTQDFETVLHRNLVRLGMSLLAAHYTSTLVGDATQLPTTTNTLPCQHPSLELAVLDWGWFHQPFMPQTHLLVVVSASDAADMGLSVAAGLQLLPGALQLPEPLQPASLQLHQGLQCCQQ